jgi:hypothetical protein
MYHTMDTFLDVNFNRMYGENKKFQMSACFDSTVLGKTTGDLS